MVNHLVLAPILTISTTIVLSVMAPWCVSDSATLSSHSSPRSSHCLSSLCVSHRCLSTFFVLQGFNCNDPLLVPSSVTFVNLNKLASNILFSPFLFSRFSNPHCSSELVIFYWYVEDLPRATYQHINKREQVRGLILIRLVIFPP